MNGSIVWLVLLLFGYAFATLLVAARRIDVSSRIVSTRARVQKQKAPASVRAQTR